MKSYRTMVLLLVAILLVGSAFTAFASDVPANHWAKETIDAVVEANIMDLYEGARFMPSDSVTHVEAVVVIYRAALAAGFLNDVPIGTLTLSYEERLEGMGLPKMLAPYGGDVYPAMAYALENNIITMEEARTFVRDGQLTTINKVNAAVFVGRALNVYKNENLNRIIVLNYKDDFAIPLSARRYVFFLIENGILSPDGDSAGNFNPASTMNRTLMAVFAKGYYDVLLTIEKAVETTTPPVEETPATDLVLSKIVSGSIVSVDDEKREIVVETRPEEKIAFKLSHAAIYFEEEIVGWQVMTLDAPVRVHLENGMVTTVEVLKLPSVLEGTLSLIGERIQVSPSFRSIRFQALDTSFQHKRLYDDALITLNGKPVAITDLSVGDRVSVLYDDHTILRITAYSGDDEMRGILLKDLESAGRRSLKMITEKGFLFESDVPSSTILIGSQNGFDAQTIVKVKISNGMLMRMEHLGKAEQVSGKIKGIHIKESPELTLTIGTATRTFILSDQVRYLDELGQKSLEIYDLRLNQEVTVQTGIDGVIRVQIGAVKKPVKEDVTYTVTQIFTSANLMTVVDADGKVKTVVLSSSSEMDLSDYQVGQVLYIEGILLTQDLLEATKITVKTE